jgi:hypothetical protein
MNVANFKNNFNKEHFSRWIHDFWGNHSRMLFSIFSAAVLSAGIYFWYQNTYQSDWNSEQRNQYKVSQDKQTKFKEQEFKKVIAESENRKKIYEESLTPAKDIFASYQGETPEN